MVRKGWGEWRKEKGRRKEGKGISKEVLEAETLSPQSGSHGDRS